MKKRMTLMVLVFALTICCHNSYYGIASAKKIMAHYMPWYQSPPLHNWGWHWTMNTFNPPTTFASHFTPLLGLYDSNDPQVLASQVLLMKFGGFDGLIADWYGIDDFYDYGSIRDATNSLIPYVKDADLQFAICYEDHTVAEMNKAGWFANRAAAVAYGAGVMQWLQSHYFTDSAYTKIDNRPVLLCFGPQFFTYNSDWVSMFAALSPKPQFFPFRTNCCYSSTETGGFDWPIPQSGTVKSNLDYFYSAAASNHWTHYIAVAFPRFYDIYVEGGAGPSLGYIDANGTYDGTYKLTYLYTLERALQSSADIVQVATWNDYGEGTIVEPTVEDGYLFLEKTQQLRKQYIDPNFSYTAANLRLPVRLYTLRKANLSNPAALAQLATVEDYLFANNLSAAKALLDQIDCSTLGVFTSAWLSEPGDGNWNPGCDISLPADNIINFLDFAVFAQNWLTSKSY
ncbi:MAG: glycoside hydrolase family 71/99-like protein [Sedimentisphaerales bacterium]